MNALLKLSSLLQERVEVPYFTCDACGIIRLYSKGKCDVCESIDKVVEAVCEPVPAKCNQCGLLAVMPDRDRCLLCILNTARGVVDPQDHEAKGIADS